MNAVWDGDMPERIDEVNVGIAVAVDDGLIVPVVHRANGLDVIDVAKRRSDVVERARSETPLTDDVSGGTFTVSNLGMFGIDSFTAIVNGPQAAILAVGRVADQVVAVEDRPVVAPRMSLTLSCDHRVLDGARAARFPRDPDVVRRGAFGSPRDGKRSGWRSGSDARSDGGWSPHSRHCCVAAACGDDGETGATSATGEGGQHKASRSIGISLPLTGDFSQPGGEASAATRLARPHE